MIGEAGRGLERQGFFMTDKDYAEWYGERAGVYEYDAGLNRTEAERRAWKEMEELKLKQGEKHEDNRNQKRGTD